MADDLRRYDDTDRTPPWHDSEMIRVRTPDLRSYKLAYHIDKDKGTMIELPGGRCISVRDAERAGLVVKFPKVMRDFELSTCSEHAAKMREKRKAAKAGKQAEVA